MMMKGMLGQKERLRKAAGQRWWDFLLPPHCCWWLESTKQVAESLLATNGVLSPPLKLARLRGNDQIHWGQESSNKDIRTNDYMQSQIISVTPIVKVSMANRRKGTQTQRESKGI